MKQPRFTHDWLTRGRGSTTWAVLDEDDGTHIAELETSEYPAAEAMCKAMAEAINNLKLGNKE